MLAIVIVIVAVLGFIGLMTFGDPAPASADQAKFYLECPDSEVREGESHEAYPTLRHCTLVTG